MTDISQTRKFEVSLNKYQLLIIHSSNIDIDKDIEIQILIMLSNKVEYLLILTSCKTISKTIKRLNYFRKFLVNII